MNPPEPGGQAGSVSPPVRPADDQLSLAARVRLLTGSDSWRTGAAPELGLRQMTTSDGPSGARGVSLDENAPSTCLPCPSAIGATWDPDLVERVARELGTEARSKGIDILLAPTINLMRTPLGGRGFECFSEDPLLTGQIGAAYVRGVQAAGVAATVKHFIGNDSETERWTYDARIAPGVLREVYLWPFEVCVRDAGTALVMASYNKVNGVPMTEHRGLLTEILRDEWGFTGVVISDWSAARSTVPTATGGLDLVMPGPDGPWGDLLVRAVEAGAVSEALVDDKVARLLRLADRVGARTRTPAATGTGAARQAGSDGSLRTGRAEGPRYIGQDLLRAVTAASFVLLRNQSGVLPLDPGSIGRLALIGPNAVRPSIQGGGSVTVRPARVRMPAESLTDLAEATSGFAVTVAQGCRNELAVPLPPTGSLHDPVTGEPGVRIEFRGPGGDLLAAEHASTSSGLWWDGTPDQIGWGRPGTLTLLARFRAEASGEHTISAAGVGDLAIAIDGHEIAAGRTPVPDDPVQSMVAPPDLQVTADLTAGSQITVTITLRPASDGAGPLAIRLGIASAQDDDALLAEAERAAAAADVAVVVVGSPEMGETEGMDRATLALPGRQDELVARVAAACQRTIVVVNAGMPVLMPWLDQVSAVLWAWLPGQEFGAALADVLAGRAEPGGRLPVTLPADEASCPVLHAIPDDGVLRYDEGALVGYRGYDAAEIAPAFPFGHGLGYTRWTYDGLRLPRGLAAGQDLVVEVDVTNAGARSGREVVQAYVEPPAGGPGRPVRVLGGFASAEAEPGKRVTVGVRIPARVFARWDETAGQWAWQPGQYRIRVGSSSRVLPLTAAVTSGPAEPSPA